MKKTLVVILAILMAVSLIGCTKKSDSWPKTGSYYDRSHENILMIGKSKSSDQPEWEVNVIGTDIYHGYFTQNNDSLQGELIKESEISEKITATISKEDKDGCLLKLSSGEEFHFISITNPEAVLNVSISTEGSGQVAFAFPGENIVFNDSNAGKPYNINVWEPDHYTFAAKADEGWRFRHWILNGDLLSQEAQIELYVDRNYELTAVFTKS